MADVFRGGEVSTRRKLSADFKNGAVLILHGCQAEHAAHAIDSHDELVAEVERLREMVCRIGMYLEMSGEYPENESDNPISQWLYDSIQYMASTVDD